MISAENAKRISLNPQVLGKLFHRLDQGLGESSVVILPALVGKVRANLHRTSPHVEASGTSGETAFALARVR